MPGNRKEQVWWNSSAKFIFLGCSHSQCVIALCPGGALYYGLVMRVSSSIRLLSLAADLVVDVRIRHTIDSSAEEGIANWHIEGKTS